MLSRASSEERQRSNRYSTGGSGEFGSVIRKSGPMKMSSSAALRRPTALSKTGKCRTMKR